MKKYKFHIFTVLAIITILLSILVFVTGVWADNEWMDSLKRSSVYYLAMGMIYILASKKCQDIYRYILAFPSIFILQILSFFRIKYSLIWVNYGKIVTFQDFTRYHILNEGALAMVSIPLLIMLIGFIQYFDILRRITEIEKYEMGFKTWKN